MTRSVDEALPAFDAIQQLLAAAERVSYKYGKDQNGDTPRDGSEWADLRQAILAVKTLMETTSSGAVTPEDKMCVCGHAVRHHAALVGCKLCWCRSYNGTTATQLTEDKHEAFLTWWRETRDVTNVFVRPVFSVALDAFEAGLQYHRKTADSNDRTAVQQ